VDLPLPDGPFAFGAAAMLLAEEGRFSLAERCARRALAFQADYPPALLALGIALDGLGRPREAEASLCEALALDPAYGRLYGRFFHRLFGRPDAVGALRELERLAPWGIPIPCCRGWRWGAFPARWRPTPACGSPACGEYPR
jgi:tetratricopeptide (TPR) repeat protein